MKSYTAAQVRAAEAPLLEAGVPLMERAAEALAEEAATLLAEYRGGVRGSQVLLLVGSGNNGGDTLYAGAILAADGAIVTIVPTSATLHEGGLEAALDAGARIVEFSAEPARLAEPAAASDLILDGILGTGTSAAPALRGAAREIVAAILPALDGDDGPLVVAVDIPSGIGPDDGSVPDPTVLPAYLTVTFGGCKTGLLREPASRYAGRVVVADIGLGDELDRVAPQA